jgi:integrase/recombinase XerD
LLLKTALEEFLAGYFSTHRRSTKTKSAYAADLKQFGVFVGPDVTITAVKAFTIENWAAHLHQTGYSPRSVRRKIAALKVFCSYWLRRDILTESPFWRVKLSFGRVQELPRTLTQAEIRNLLITAHKQQPSTRQRKNCRGFEFRHYRALRNLALIEVLFATGIRVGEAASLNVEHFNADDSAFLIKGKGGRDRLAFIVDPKTIQIIERYLSFRQMVACETNALFLNPARKRLSTQGIANVVSKFRRQINIERPVTPHMFRHTIATLLLRNGVDIRVVQEFLGHASIATTQQYTHVAKDHLVAVLTRHHPSLQLRE